MVGFVLAGMYGSLGAFIFVYLGLLFGFSGAVSHTVVCAFLRKYFSSWVDWIVISIITAIIFGSSTSIMFRTFDGEWGTINYALVTLLFGLIPALIVSSLIKWVILGKSEPNKSLKSGTP